MARYLFRRAYTQTFAPLQTHVRGLLSGPPREAVEPLAPRGGPPVRTPQEVLKGHDWDRDEVRDLRQREVAQLVPTLPDGGRGVVGLIDETSPVKRGTRTPGARRQYLGRVGEADSGIVAAHLGGRKGRSKTLLDGDLFLPGSWSGDRPRRREAGIPKDAVHRPKWRIALEQLDRVTAHGLALGWLTFDEEYGKRPGFVGGPDQRRRRLIGEVPRDFSCLAANRSGRRPDEETKGRAVEEVARAGSAFRGQSWQVPRLARETLPDQARRAKAARVWSRGADGWSAGARGLLRASNDEAGEEKFFPRDAPSDTPAALLARVAFRRARVEYCLRACESELGFTHFEGRNYRASRRHPSSCLPALGFVADHAERLRGEKSGGDGGASVSGAAGARPELAAATAEDQ